MLVCVCVCVRVFACDIHAGEHSLSAIKRVRACAVLSLATAVAARARSCAIVSVWRRDFTGHVYVARDRAPNRGG